MFFNFIVTVNVQCYTKDSCVHYNDSPYFFNDSQLLKVVFLFWASLVAKLIKNPPAMRETWV